MSALSPWKQVVVVVVVVANKKYNISWCSYLWLVVTEMGQFQLHLYLGEYFILQKFIIKSVVTIKWNKIHNFPAEDKVCNTICNQHNCMFVLSWSVGEHGASWRMGKLENCTIVLKQEIDCSTMTFCSDKTATYAMLHKFEEAKFKVGLYYFL